ncbi:MAG: DUF4202 domain-containing protein [Candidatus Hydrogenedentes bacterium]|nr:DUF4202 domain-containing protein [Candidatus Hydrogenedentota bacterium]
MPGAFDEAIRRIDESNSEDPNREEADGRSYPKEVLYAQRMTAWVERLDPTASEALLLAARSQHIRRWESPRSDFPMTKAGYNRWRTSLYAFHADTAASILEEAGYGPGTVRAVKNLLMKKGLRTDPEMRTLEDAATLVFLEFHFAEFAERDNMNDAKLIDILQKTWRKMSNPGRAAALKLDFTDEPARLIQKALAL